MAAHRLHTLRYALLPGSLLLFCLVMSLVLVFDIGIDRSYSTSRPRSAAVPAPEAIVISDHAVALIIDHLNRRTCANHAPTATTADIKPFDSGYDAHPWLML